MSMISSTHFVVVFNICISKQYRILGGSVLKFCRCTKTRGRSEIVDQSSEVTILDNNQTSTEVMSHDHEDLLNFENPYPLFIPGKILYLEKDYAIKKCCKKTQIYKAFWAEKEFFDEILVNRSMLLEHLPDVVCEALQTSLLNEVHDMKHVIGGDLMVIIKPCHSTQLQMSTRNLNQYAITRLKDLTETFRNANSQNVRMSFMF
ncbi:hypothetical protein HELRODRAFT_168034 [Helobdella robusta]|uniref:Uncharacterized protein n=1 Tax=Helobdella robusta TaxID=6412 RepID=T1F032_HELRO|nr:hypothetical protein HELRODRAFT_168034 [Helobdella robusta]ESO10165.1 hypothetical protein HELRODRAFT_168034 [Helobdella robusta]